MIILIAGCTHVGKTFAAQKLLEKCHYPYLSIDHLKMGLIRSKNTDLTPEDDQKLIPYLWNILKEIIKTAIENHQNMIIEGSYIPFSWKDSFSKEEQKEIRCFFLLFSSQYIQKNFERICLYANVIEKRKDESNCTKRLLIQENEYYKKMCQQYQCPYFLIQKNYEEEIKVFLALFS